MSLKQDNCSPQKNEQKVYLGILSYGKSREKILKETRERKNHLLHRGTKRNYIYLFLRNYASNRRLE